MESVWMMVVSHGLAVVCGVSLAMALRVWREQARGKDEAKG